jgi:hypothetical protein
MIKCAYCGRENEDAMQACPGCGTSPVCGPGGVETKHSDEGCARLVFTSEEPVGLRLNIRHPYWAGPHVPGWPSVSQPIAFFTWIQRSYESRPSPFSACHVT